jgi:hypothetical protein
MVVGGVKKDYQHFPSPTLRLSNLGTFFAADGGVWPSRQGWSKIMREVGRLASDPCSVSVDILK